MGRLKTEERFKRNMWVSMRIPHQLYWKIKEIADVKFGGNFSEAAISLLTLYLWFERILEEMIDRAIVSGKDITIKSKENGN